MKPLKIKHPKKNISLQGLDRRYDIDPASTIDVGVLRTVPYEYPRRDVIVTIDTNEFTVVCPYSGLPDYAVLKIHYLPRNLLIELRSLKYYLFSFRNVGMFQEHVVNRILEDLIRCCHPRWMQVVADYNLRGGLHTVTTTEWGKRKR
jgi:7-cyano-7-deazaguanine reductase